MSLMFFAVSSLLAALMAFAAARKLTHSDRVVAEYARTGVPEDMLSVLAMVLLAGAAGLILGFFWRPANLVAGSVTFVYFLVATAFHVRSRDVAHIATPIVLAALAAASLSLALLTS